MTTLMVFDWLVSGTLFWAYTFGAACGWYGFLVGRRIGQEAGRR